MIGLSAETTRDALAGQFPRGMNMPNHFMELLNSRSGRPLVIAHRGDSFHGPENTLEAARLGWETGADAWELDVQLTRDGVAVVFHDEVLTRTTDVADRFQGDPRGEHGFRLCDFDWSDVRDTRRGILVCRGDRRAAVGRGAGNPSGYSPFTPGSLPIRECERYPRSRDALALTADLDWLVNVEIKSFPDKPRGLVEAVLSAIDGNGYGQPGFAFELRSSRDGPNSSPGRIPSRRDADDSPRDPRLVAPVSPSNLPDRDRRGADLSHLR